MAIFSALRSQKTGRLYFLHIPKTGGSTVTHALKKIASHKNLQSMGPLLMDDLLRPRNIRWRATDILIGHLGLLPIAEALPDHAVTVVRNPVDYMVSYYKHIRRAPEHYGHRLIVEKNLTFSEWIQHPDFRLLTDNPQARMLSSLPPIPSGQYRSKDPTAWQTAFESQERATSDTDVLADALDTLEALSLVGTTDCLDEFLQSLSELLHVPHFTSPRMNVSAREEQIDLGEEEISIIRSKTSIDFQIWDSVKRNPIRFP